MNRQYLLRIYVMGKSWLANLSGGNDTGVNLTLGRQPKRNTVQVGIKSVRLCLPPTPRRPPQRRGCRPITDVVSPNLELGANSLGLLVDCLLIPRHANGCGLAPPRDEVVEQHSLLAIGNGDAGKVGPGAGNGAAGYDVGLLLEGQGVGEGLCFAVGRLPVTEVDYELS